jgi:hypothetical protein
MQDSERFYGLAAARDEFKKKAMITIRTPNPGPNRHVVKVPPEG